MLRVLLILSSFLLIFETAALKNNVTPNKTIGCFDDWSSCLTLQEYAAANQPNVYFTNDTLFYFKSSSHILNNSLTLTNLLNFTFQGLLYRTVTAQSEADIVNVCDTLLVS